MDRKLLTPDETAEIFGVTRETVLAWGQAGRIPIVRVTRKLVRFDPRDVQQLIEAMKTGRDIRAGLRRRRS